MIHFNSFSQYSEKIKHFLSEIQPVDSSKVVLKYKNGNIKKEVTTYNYIVDGKNYSLTGNTFFYRKDGSPIVKNIIDRFGFLLEYVLYDKKGRILNHSKTSKIDTKNNTLSEFFNNKKGHTIITFDKSFYADKKYYFLMREGAKENSNKIGVWRKYNACGDTIKIKDFK